MKKSTLLLFSITMILFTCGSPQEKEIDFRSLFNGVDLEGWETFIGVPPSDVEIPGMEKDTSGMYTEPIGLNKDPLGIFNVVEEDGAPAVHVTGQVNGSLATTEEFENYHFRMEMKWGEKKWLGDDRLRNSGLLYHGVGDYGAGFGVWKKSHECQLMETMAGDSYRMGDTYCSIRAKLPEGEDRYIYDPEAKFVEFGEGKTGGKICSKNVTNEKPVGEWNTIEIICLGDTSLHIINGVVNMINIDSHLEENGRIIPLTGGNIQLQSEGAEVYFRKMEISKIAEIPEEYLQ